MLKFEIPHDPCTQFTEGSNAPTGFYTHFTNHLQRSRGRFNSERTRSYILGLKETRKDRTGVMATINPSNRLGKTRNRRSTRRMMRFTASPDRLDFYILRTKPSKSTAAGPRNVQYSGTSLDFLSCGLSFRFERLYDGVERWT